MGEEPAVTIATTREATTVFPKPIFSNLELTSSFSPLRNPKKSLRNDFRTDLLLINQFCLLRIFHFAISLFIVCSKPHLVSSRYVYSIFCTCSLILSSSFLISTTLSETSAR
jgi:hypothetical protein